MAAYSFKVTRSSPLLPVSQAPIGGRGSHPISTLLYSDFLSIWLLVSGSFIFWLVYWTLVIPCQRVAEILEMAKSIWYIFEMMETLMSSATPKDLWKMLIWRVYLKMQSRGNNTQEQKDQVKRCWKTSKKKYKKVAQFWNRIFWTDESKINV